MKEENFVLVQMSRLDCFQSDDFHFLVAEDEIDTFDRVSSNFI